MDKPTTNKDIMEELLMSKKEKKRHQVKSRFYYIFWGAATVSVLAGQLYVGSGYRMYARALMTILDAVEVETRRI
jgi:hypothetical protein